MAYTFVLSAATRASQVQSGQADMAIDLDPLAVAAVNGSGGHVTTASYGQNLLIYVNKVVKYGPSDTPKYELTTDPAVRKSVSLAIDRDAFVNSATIYNGTRLRADGWPLRASSARTPPMSRHSPLA